MDTMAAYAAFLRENPQELDLLFKELLIGVTSFFRDAAVWQALSDIVLPTLLARHAANAGPLRAWVVGCSTGEEAYSLAMVFTEAVESLPQPGVLPAADLCHRPERGRDRGGAQWSLCRHHRPRPDASAAGALLQRAGPTATRSTSAFATWCCSLSTT